MASAVATPLERQFGRIAGLNEMTSVSSLGATRITLQFDLGRRIDAAARDVQAAINAAQGQLPPNLPSAPRYRKTIRRTPPLSSWASPRKSSTEAACTTWAPPFWSRNCPRCRASDGSWWRRGAAGGAGGRQSHQLE